MYAMGNSRQEPTHQRTGDSGIPARTDKPNGPPSLQYALMLMCSTLAVGRAYIGDLVADKLTVLSGPNLPVWSTRVVPREIFSSLG